MLNGLFVTVVVVSVLAAAVGGRMDVLTRATLDSAKDAVTLAIGLVGAMALFLGLMRVATAAGLLRELARLTAPVLRRLFPGIPPDHPAMSAIVLNVGSNLMGLGNAATPFGIQAMREMSRLSGGSPVASDAMIVFLAINTAGLTILPTSVLAMRASVGSQDPAAVLVPIWIASAVATLVGVTAALTLARTRRATAHDVAQPAASSDAPTVELPGPDRVPPRGGSIVVLAFAAAVLAAAVLHLARRPDALRELLSFWILPVLVALMVLWGWARGVKVYERLVEGAREGFDVAVRIIPYLVAILVMVGMFRASGALDALVAWVGGVTSAIGVPPQVLPVALVRPLSGSGALALVADVMRASGPDSLAGLMASTIHGSTETTFYVLAVYCGAAGVRRTRHALPACLLADLAGISTAILLSQVLFG